MADMQISAYINDINYCVLLSPFLVAEMQGATGFGFQL